jgi:hypothetical protein
MKNNLSRRELLKVGGLAMASFLYPQNSYCEDIVSISVSPEELKKIEEEVYFNKSSREDKTYYHPQGVQRAEIMKLMKRKSEIGTGSEAIELNEDTNKFRRIIGSYAESRGLELIAEWYDLSLFLAGKLMSYEKYKDWDSEKLVRELVEKFGIMNVTNDVKQYYKAIRS